MGKILLSLFLCAFFTLSLSANCQMKEVKKQSCNMVDCKNENCSMHMKKQKCDMPNCKNENCNFKMHKIKKESCDMASCKNENCNMKKHNHHNMMKKDTKRCGCGMTIESCKKMMVSCKFRDQREAKEAKIN